MTDYRSSARRNGLAAKVLAGVLTALLAGAVVGAWGVRDELSRLGTAVEELTKRVDRLDARLLWIERGGRPLSSE